MPLKWDPVRRQIWRRSFSRMHPWYREGKAGMRRYTTGLLADIPRKTAGTWAEG